MRCRPLGRSSKLKEEAVVKTHLEILVAPMTDVALQLSVYRRILNRSSTGLVAI